jgi:hypothetical protein
VSKIHPLASGRGFLLRFLSMKEVEESFQAAGVNVRPEVLIDEAQYATVGAKEDSAVIFYPSKAQFAQRAISAERIPPACYNSL